MPKIIADPFGNANDNALSVFGLDYDNLSLLFEAGLLRHDFSEWREISQSYWLNSHPLDVAGQTFWLDCESTDTSSIPSSLRFTGPTFSLAGAELRRVVDMEVSGQYIATLAKWLKPRRIRLIRAVGRVGDQLQGEVVEPAGDA